MEMDFAFHIPAKGTRNDTLSSKELFPFAVRKQKEKNQTHKI